MGKDERSGQKWYYSFLPNNMAGGSTSPLIPLFLTQALGGNVAQVGLVSAISSMASVPSNILWGNLSDTVKKRRLFVLIGFGGMAMALLMMGLSTDLPSYLFANFMLGLLSTAAAPVGTVLILESFDKKEWAKRLGDFSKVGGIGWLTGLLLGTIWLQFLSDANSSLTMRALFILAACLAGVSMLLAYRWVPEPDEVVDRKEAHATMSSVHLMTFERARYLPQRLIHVLKISTHNLRVETFPPCLRQFYVYTFIMFTGFLTFYVGLPVFLSQYVGLSSSEVFLIYMASSLVSALTYSQAGKWATAIGSKRMLSSAVIGRAVLFPSFFAVTLLGLGKIELLAIFCVLHGLVGFCWANVSVAGSHIVSKICYQEFRAESTGVYNAMQGTATIAGALIGGFVAQAFGYQVVFLCASAFLIVGLSLLARINTEKEPSAQDGPVCQHA